MLIPDKSTGSSYTAAEFNEFKNETQNTILSSGQPLSGVSTQLQQALSRYAASGSYYQDTGGVNTVVLSLFGSFQALTAYTEGAYFMWIANTTNTGATTINVSGLGAVGLKKNQWTTDLSAGDHTAGRLYAGVYDTSTGFVELIDLAAGLTFPITETQGGTNQTTYAQGDTIYASAVDTISKATIGSFGQVWRVNSAGTLPEWGVIPTACVVDQKTATTQGGTFTSGAWRTRDLNTTLWDDIGITVSTNQITLPAGTYLMHAIAPALRVDEHKTKIYNISDATDEEIGTSGYGNPSVAVNSYSETRAKITIASSKIFEVQHICDVTRATDGFGQGQGIGGVEKYTVVFITKIA